MRPTLKPCPFCGGEAEYWTEPNTVECTICEARLGGSATRAGVMRCWNQRPLSPEPTDADQRHRELMAATIAGRLQVMYSERHARTACGRPTNEAVAKESVALTDAIVKEARRD